MLLGSLRFFLVIFAVICLWVLWQLPTSVKAAPEIGLAALPDADLAALAEKHWRDGYRETAISTLQYAVDQAHSDAKSAQTNTGMVQHLALTEQLLKEYKATLSDEASLDGRLLKMGSGAITGNIDSWESMAGSTVADLFIVGDIRDLIVEGLIAEDSDELILTLSAVGIATTVWPPADPAVSMLKAARKSQSISQPIVNQLIKTGKAYKQAPNAKTQAAFIDTVKPLWDMGNKCHSWSQFKLLLKHSNKIDDVKTINRMMSAGPQQAKQINTAFAVCHRSSGAVKGLFKLFNNAGQRSCDAIYAVLRKGPRGITWLAKHPSLIARLSKVAYKDASWAYNAALRHYGKHMLWLRNAAILCCLALIILCTPIKRLLFRKKSNASTETPSPRLPIRKIIIVASLIALTCVSLGGLGAALQGDPVQAWQPSELGLSPRLDIIQENTRELRISMREYDSVDPNDYLLRRTCVPLISDDKGMQWIFCTRHALGLDWPEIQDGDIDQLSIIISKRGPNPHSIRLRKPIHLFAKDQRFCLIPCPPELGSSRKPQALGEAILKTLHAQQVKLLFVQASQQLKGATIGTYSVGPDSMAVKLHAAEHDQARLGDFLLSPDGAFVGYFITATLVRYLPLQLHTLTTYQVRHLDYNQDGYYSQFVSDVKALP